ncbi:hypothetical protein [Streptomyces hundungensis]|uniref:hypothetical protein n=1 Tax=Streptomyces hundungensis TaxID=1077946 RepID=UPI0031E64C4D
MHRTRNALRLLTAAATLAVCGCVAGCVAVGGGPAPAAPPAPPARQQQASAAVQAPAREALDTVQPPDAPSPVAPTAPAPPTPPEQEPHARPDPPRRERRSGAEEQEPTHHPFATPGRRRPRSAPPQPAPGGDLCALGRRYGGWREDSPEARICRATYGN